MVRLKDYDEVRQMELETLQRKERRREHEKAIELSRKKEFEWSHCPRVLRTEYWK
jgi:hypothetical protein